MNCMNCGSANDTTDFLANGEKMILCVNCRYDLASGKLKLPFKTMGRPSLGITKKVSLTLPEKMWEHVDHKANGNRSDYLRSLVDRDMSEENKWTNQSCLGYTIAAATQLGFSPEQIELLIGAMYDQLDTLTVTEAREIHNKFQH